MTPERDIRGTRDLAKTGGEWIPVLVAWVAVLGLLLAIAGALLGEPG